MVNKPVRLKENPPRNGRRAKARKQARPAKRGPSTEWSQGESPRKARLTQKRVFRQLPENLRI